MIFDVAIGDRVRAVSVVRKGAVLHVEVDGRLHIVDARPLDEWSLSMLVQSDAAGMPARSVDASFAKQATAGDFDVHVAGRTLPVQVRPSTWMTRQSPSSALRAGQAGSFGRQNKGGAAAHGSGPQCVTAPMPGKIVRILVKPGDHVTARQGLVVVEAMKMENELRAARDGRVRELSVAEGQSVDAGTVLLVVE